MKARRDTDGCTFPAIQEAEVHTKAKDHGGKAKQSKKGKGTHGHAGTRELLEGDGELSDGIEIIREPSTTAGKGSQKVTVEDVDDEGDDTHRGGGVARNKEKSKSSSLEDEQEQLDNAWGAGVERMCAKWTSVIYAFYEEAEIRYKDNHQQHSFKCSNQGCKIHVNHFLDTKDAMSTSNLCHHVLDCWGPELLKMVQEMSKWAEVQKKIVKSVLMTGTIMAYFEWKQGAVTYQNRPFMQAEMHMEIVKWVCECVWPFNIVRDPGFLVLMKMGCPNYYIPSPSTIAWDVKEIFMCTCNWVVKMLQEYDGELNFATDCWTSPNHHAFIAFMVHFLYEGEAIALLLDFVEVAASYTSAEMANMFTEMLLEFRVQGKINSITIDNTSNNEMMIKAIGEDDHLPHFNGHHTRVRCFLHILNLVVKSLVSQFDLHTDKVKAVKDKSDPELLMLKMDLVQFESQPCQKLAGEEEDRSDDDDDDDEVNVMEDMSNEEHTEFEGNMCPVKVVLVKIQMFAFKIINSTTKLLPAWQLLCVAENEPKTLLLRDVRTCWNSTFDMLAGALTHRGVIDKMCRDKLYGLQAYELSSAEWRIARHLHKVLEHFKHSTFAFSQAMPHLAKVILAIDKCDWFLTDCSHNNKLDPTIHIACNIVKGTLNQYYSLMDTSKACRIAMVMHSHYKMTYFEQLKWPNEWKKVTCDLVEEEWQTKYANDSVCDLNELNTQASTPPCTPTPAGDSSEGDGEVEEEPNVGDGIEIDDNNNNGGSALGDKFSADIFDIFDNTMPPALTELGDELDCYLWTPIEHTPDVIKWWVDRHAMYPKLSCMALDYLTIPATSIDVERVFSQGRLLLSHIRNCLSVQSMCAILCLGSWAAAGFVKAADEWKVAKLEDVDDEDPDASDFKMEDSWDAIDVSKL